AGLAPTPQERRRVAHVDGGGERDRRARGHPSGARGGDGRGRRRRADGQRGHRGAAAYAHAGGLHDHVGGAGGPVEGGGGPAAGFGDQVRPDGDGGRRQRSVGGGDRPRHRHGVALGVGGRGAQLDVGAVGRGGHDLV